MKRLTKLLSVLLVVVTLSSCCLVGCQGTKNKTYDVTIKVQCSTGEEWVFTPDVDTLYWEIDYDGIERTFHVDKYKMEKHPQLNKWYDPIQGSDIFFRNLLYGDNEKWIYEKKDLIVCEKGNYCLVISTDATSNLWNYRSIKLNISVV